ncbi:MAG: ATP-binding protein [Candidatus Eisenbacteria sp.]|nr:ATP-binding protein [Candidatus Eisenbacteria bacterium]
MRWTATIFQGRYSVVLDRHQQVKHARRLLRDHRVVGIVGARQVGKTTLARQIVERHDGPATVFDLENPEDLSRLSDPMLALKELRGLVVIDEIQRIPEVFPVIRVLVDRPRHPARFLVLGSASPNLLRQSSESLAGRIAYHELEGFSIEEVSSRKASQLWLRGGFPRSFLARSARASMEWRREFVGTFLERDIPQLGIRIPAPTMRRFWSMLAHYHGQIWNASEFARSFGVGDTTVRRYLDLLESVFMVRQLQPFHANLAKRQVRAPKVYLADTGMLHALLDLPDRRSLEGHPKLGASWEWFAMNAVIGQVGARREQCYFWATHAGAELDLLIVRGQHRWGLEFKRTSAPKITRSMRTAMADLRLKRLDVIHAGAQSFPLAKNINAVSFSRIRQDLLPLPGMRS